MHTPHMHSVLVAFPSQERLALWRASARAACARNDHVIQSRAAPKVKFDLHPHGLRAAPMCMPAFCFDSMQHRAAPCLCSHAVLTSDPVLQMTFVHARNLGTFALLYKAFIALVSLPRMVDSHEVK